MPLEAGEQRGDLTHAAQVSDGIPDSIVLPLEKLRELALVEFLDANPHVLIENEIQKFPLLACIAREDQALLRDDPLVSCNRHGCKTNVCEYVH